MSISTVQLIAGRIKAATEESPIAVFTTNIPGKLNSVFASTVYGQKAIKTKRAQLVGVFTSFDDNTVRRLKNACEVSDE